MQIRGRGARIILLGLAIGMTLSGCATSQKAATTSTGDAHVWGGQKAEPGWKQSGIGCWYGGGHQGGPTSSGERFNTYTYTAAHKTLAFNTKVRVTCLKTGKSVVVRINDRGPFVRGRIIDVSKVAAACVGLDQLGISAVEIVVVPQSTALGATEPGAIAKSEEKTAVTERKTVEVKKVEAEKKPQTIATPATGAPAADDSKPAAEVAPVPEKTPSSRRKKKPAAKTPAPATTPPADAAPATDSKPAPEPTPAPVPARVPQT